MPPKKCCMFLALKPLKPPKALEAWESYSQSFQATQYIHNSLAVVVVQPSEALVAPVAVQQEARQNSLMEDIKEEELGTVFEARGKTAEDEADEVHETELPELSAEEVARMDLPAVPTTWEPIAAVPELDLKVINLLDKLIFAARRASKPISGGNAELNLITFLIKIRIVSALLTVYWQIKLV